MVVSNARPVPNIVHVSNCLIKEQDSADAMDTAAVINAVEGRRIELNVAASAVVVDRSNNSNASIVAAVLSRWDLATPAKHVRDAASLSCSQVVVSDAFAADHGESVGGSLFAEQGLAAATIATTIVRAVSGYRDVGVVAE